MLRHILYKLSLPIKNDQGVAFITVLIVSTVLSLSAGAFLVQSTQEAGTVQARIESAQSFYAAESAVEWARYQLRTSSWWDVNGWIEEVPVPGENGASAVAQVNFAYDGTRGTIITTADFDGKLRKIMAQVDPHYNNFFEEGISFTKAACACGDLTLNGNTLTDSYFSSDGAYGGGNIGGAGDIGSNGNIDMRGNSEVQGGIEALGNLAGGPNASILHDGVLNGNYAGYNGGLGGNWIDRPTADPVCPCGELDLDWGINNAANNNNNNSIPAGYLAGDDFSISGNNAVTLDSGTYYFTSFSVTGNATVHINGEVVIFMDTDSDLKIAGNGGIEIDNAIDNAANLRLYTNTTGNIQIAGNGEYRGTIYAPNSSGFDAGNAEIYGAIVANNINLAGNAKIHYDETALSKGDLPPNGVDPDSVEVELITWQELDVAY